MPINYQNGKVYTILNDVNDFIYTGSTAQFRLSTRLTGHRRDCKDPTRTSNLHTAMRTIGADHFWIVLHHNFPCNSKDELEAEEYRTLQTFIDAKKNTYNMRVAGNKATEELKVKLRALARETDHFNFGHIEFRFDTRAGRTPCQFWSFRYRLNGSGHTKKFSVNKHGFWGARQLAEDERKRIYPEWKTDEEVALTEFLLIEI